MRNNNFDIIRLFAALLVLVSHSFALTGLAYDPVNLWLGGYDTGGGVGVAIFFVLSGFLVSASVSRRSTVDYLASRSLRILPALASVTAFEVFVIGAFFTKLNLASYFGDMSTWSYLSNVMIIRGIDFNLPGVFESMPYSAVNGSLWTLPVECALYLILPGFALCRGITPRGTIIAFVLCACGYFVATGYTGLDWWSQGPEMFKGVKVYSILKLGTFFFAGAMFWANRDAISLHKGGAVICFLLLIACSRTVGATAVYFLCLPYLVLYVALRCPVVSLEKIGDLSYGTYLFAFPIQQSLVSIFGASVGPLRLTAAAIPVTLAMAFLSWRLVERPSLRWRGRMDDGRPVVAITPLAA